MKKHLNLIFASGKKGELGAHNQLPWHLKEDLKFFSNITQNYQKSFFDVSQENQSQNAIIMGRKTFESFGSKALPNRKSLVISRNKLNTNTQNKNIIGVGSLQEAIDYCSDSTSLINEPFIIGGSSIYDQTFSDHEDKLKTIFQTRIGQEFPGCDTFIDLKHIDQTFEIQEITKTQVSDGKMLNLDKELVPHQFNYDFVKRINPKLYSENYQEFSQKTFSSSHDEYQYLKIIEEVIRDGNLKGDRTGTGTRSLFGKSMRYDLKQGFPLLTTKRVFWRGVVEELIWFLQGNTNGKDLADKGVKIWDGNGSREFLDNLGFQHREEGDLGPVYGFQWRHFGAEYKDYKADYAGQGVDQIQEVIRLLKEDPDSRRMIVCAWNPKDQPLMALPPCHVLFQFYVADGRLSCSLYQRSCDVGLGVPFNIASYSLLTHIIAQICDMEVGEFVHFMGDCHVYNNHIEPLMEQIKRHPNPFPILKINKKRERVQDFKFEDFELVNYNPMKSIKMEMAV